jgi:hypothetical protein
MHLHQSSGQLARLTLNGRLPLVSPLVSCRYPTAILFLIVPVSPVRTARFPSRGRASLPPFLHPRPITLAGQRQYNDVVSITHVNLWKGRELCQNQSSADGSMTTRTLRTTRKLKNTICALRGAGICTTAFITNTFAIAKEQTDAPLSPHAKVQAPLPHVTAFSPRYRFPDCFEVSRFL